jgi:hypothetical protein
MWRAERFPARGGVRSSPGADPGREERARRFFHGRDLILGVPEFGPEAGETCARCWSTDGRASGSSPEPVAKAAASSIGANGVCRGFTLLHTPPAWVLTTVRFRPRTSLPGGGVPSLAVVAPMQPARASRTPREAAPDEVAESRIFSAGDCRIPRCPSPTPSAARSGTFVFRSRTAAIFAASTACRSGITPGCPARTSLISRR